jgi:hypothetical protein
MQKRAEFQMLDVAYRCAWRRFVIEVDLRRSRKVENIGAQQAAVAVEQAEILYRKSRNELADCIIASKSKGLSNAAGIYPRTETFNASRASVGSKRGAIFPTY